VYRYDTGLHHELTEAVRDAVLDALDAGIDPASAQASPILDGDLM
jgi:hypothetical protein